MKGYEQLPLSIRLRDSAVFDNFYVGNNKMLITFLRDFSLNKINEQFVYIWGDGGSGKTHLLQAVCNNVIEDGASAIYLPFKNFEKLSPEVLNDLENISLVCIDDLEYCAGKSVWEESIFHVFNNIRDIGSRLLIAANCPPRILKFNLPDLISRLSWGIVFHVALLSDEQKFHALKLRANIRGFKLSKEVAKFLMHRCGRGTHTLFNILEQLDQMSLAKKRKLTIPFVKEVFDL